MNQPGSTNDLIRLIEKARDEAATREERQRINEAMWDHLEPQVEKLVESLGRRYFLHREEREDLKHDVWLKIQRLIQHYDPEQGPFENVLTRAICHAAIDIGRKKVQRKGGRRDESSGDSPNVEPQFIKREVAMDGLSDQVAGPSVPASDDVLEFIKRELDLENGELIRPLEQMSTHFSLLLPKVRAACDEARASLEESKDWAAFLLFTTAKFFRESTESIAARLEMDTKSLYRASARGNLQLNEALSRRKLSKDQVKRELLLALQQEVIRLRDCYPVPMGE